MTLALAVCTTPAGAEEIWYANAGTMTMTLDQSVLSAEGLSNTSFDAAESMLDGTVKVTGPITNAGDVTIVVSSGSVVEISGIHIRLDRGLPMLARNGTFEVDDLVASTTQWTARRDAATAAVLTKYPALELEGLKPAFDQQTGVVYIAARNVVVTKTLAAMLDNPALTGRRVGSAVIELQAEWLTGHEPVFRAIESSGGVAGFPTSDGPDMIHCQLYGLGQYGREGDIVGLSVATTSWNIGDEVLPWFPMPAENHPFIVMNVYRLDDLGDYTRLIQIGQSHVKHGFCALDSSQCTTSCSGTGCSTLGIGCTDTYGAGLNASQSGLGPRYEMNAWNCEWDYETSHMSSGSHGHDGIEHRIQVHDSDLDPVQHPNSQWVSESFYLAPEDVNPINSAAWKFVTPVGAPGGTWTFEMTGSGEMPEIGVPIDAWETTYPKVTVAQEVPVVMFVSPDGRCLVGAEATDIGGGLWHYEYAVYNLDMERKVGSFSIPIANETAVTNIGFHAVLSHDEPYGNDAWDVEVGNGKIEWSTLDNPIRWSTMYNFWFDCNAVPTEVAQITFGMYEPGIPDSITATMVGPLPGPPDCNDNDIIDNCDISCEEEGCDVPGCGMSEDCNGNGIPDECERDLDGDGLIDACDPDIDGDGVLNEADVCGMTPSCILVDAEGRPTMDINDNCLLDLPDYRYMDNCMSGGGPGSSASGLCSDMYDSDSDGDVDLMDFMCFQKSFGKSR